MKYAFAIIAFWITSGVLASCATAAWLWRNQHGVDGLSGLPSELLWLAELAQYVIDRWVRVTFVAIVIGCVSYMFSISLKHGANRHDEAAVNKIR